MPSAACRPLLSAPPGSGRRPLAQGCSGASAPPIPAAPSRGFPPLAIITTKTKRRGVSTIINTAAAYRGPRARSVATMVTKLPLFEPHAGNPLDPSRMFVPNWGSSGPKVFANGRLAWRAMFRSVLVRVPTPIFSSGPLGAASPRAGSVAVGALVVDALVIKQGNARAALILRSRHSRGTFGRSFLLLNPSAEALHAPSRIRIPTGEGSPQQADGSFSEIHGCTLFLRMPASLRRGRGWQGQAGGIVAASLGHGCTAARVASCSRFRRRFIEAASVPENILGVLLHRGENKVQGLLRNVISVCRATVVVAFHLGLGIMNVNGHLIGGFRGGLGLSGGVHGLPQA